jgi:hypothetical protein
MGNPLVLAGSTGEPWTPGTAVAGRRPMKNRGPAVEVFELND